MEKSNTFDAYRHYAEVYQQLLALYVTKNNDNNNNNNTLTHTTTISTGRRTTAGTNTTRIASETTLRTTRLQSTSISAIADTTSDRLYRQFARRYRFDWRFFAGGERWIEGLFVCLLFVCLVVCYFYVMMMMLLL
jgi:hypothetical protein